jgi:hypothetical protein
MVQKSKAEKALYEKIWQPIEKQLEGVRNVYYSPSGLLHKVSLRLSVKTIMSFYVITTNSTNKAVQEKWHCPLMCSMMQGCIIYSLEAFSTTPIKPKKKFGITFPELNAKQIIFKSFYKSKSIR